MRVSELIKDLQEIKKHYGNLDVCVCTDEEGNFGAAISYPEVVDAIVHSGDYEYVGDATLDGPGDDADAQVVFIRFE